MRIGQLAQLVGVETQTIRFYEQQGLLYGKSFLPIMSII